MKVTELYQSLYHFTDFLSLDMIISSDVLGKGPVSLTLNPLHDFHKRAQVCLVLDRAEIHQDFKIIASKGDGHKFFTNVLQDEQEERTDRAIKPLHQYLLAIFINTRTRMQDWAEIQMDVERYCREYDIELKQTVMPNTNWIKAGELVL